MRTIQYKDLVWSVAYKIGLDPSKELLQDQADACASYINGWFRRLYDVQDWPEWTITRELVPNANHIVPYTVQLGNVLGQSPVETIGRVFKVYLLDPTTTQDRFETPFRLTPEGIFVGFEHGSSVWVRYIPACPQFTSTPWRSDYTYGLGDLVYLPNRGECYKSRTANNKGHDPSTLLSHQGENNPPPGIGGSPPPIPIVTEITDERVPANPGTPQQNEIMRISLLSMSPGPDPSDPPASGSFWSIVTTNDIPHVGVAVHTADGVETMSDITTAMASDLQGGLAGFGYTVTADTVNAVINIEGPEAFNPDPHCIYTPPGGTPVSHLKAVISQPFVPATAGTDGSPQVTKISLTADQLFTGATYTTVITDAMGEQHSISYTAQVSDSPQQILLGLSNALTTARNTDPFLDSVSAVVDLDLLTLTISSVDDVSVDTGIQTPQNAWWIRVEVPQVMADMVIRGQMSDVYREEGQTDRADSEEGKVQTEMGVAVSKFTSPQYMPLTDQQKPRSRYMIK